MSSGFKPRYSENSSSLWTPFATGAFPLSTPLVFQLDADFTASFVTASGESTYNGSYYVVSGATDNVSDIEFGMLDPTDGRTQVRYYHTGTDAYIGNRPTLWFWEHQIRYGPHTTLTASQASFNSGKLAGLPGGNDDRAVFFVLRVNGLRTYTNPNPNSVWQYGDQQAGEGYGFGLVETGSSGDSDFRTTNPGNAIMLKGAGMETFQSGSDLILNSPTGAFGATPDIWYMFHSSSSTGSIQKNGQPEQYLYSASLSTQTGSDGSRDATFYIGQQLPNGASYAGDYVLGEMLILDGVPSEDDQQRIEGYLAWKWDLTSSLPASHPYKDTQPLNSDGTLSFTFTGSNVAPQLGSVTGTYSVQRVGGFNALTATINFTGTAVSGTDFTGSTFPLTLNWEASETGSKDFTVTFLSNPSTTKTFTPFISDSGDAITEEPTGSSTTIIYPGIFNFHTSSETIGEGQNTVIQVNRTSGTFGEVNVTIGIQTGSNAWDYENDLTFQGITFGPSGGDVTGTISIHDGDSSGFFALTASDDVIDEGTESGSFELFSLGYSLSDSRFFPTAAIGFNHSFSLSITDNESGSLRINNPDGHYFYTASMPVTWSIERMTFADGIATATVDLIASGGYPKAVFGVDYTGSSGSFPYSFTWADQESGSKSFSIFTVGNSALTGVSISPIITSTSSSFGTELTGSPDSQPAWVAYPGVLYMTPTDDTVVEGESFNVQLARRSGEDGDLTGTITFTGTATSGTDYHPQALLDDPPLPPNYYLSVGDDDSSTIFEIQTVDDTVNENNETITISINNSSGTIYHFSASDGYYTDGTLYAFNTSSLISTNPSFITSSTTTIIDNETGTVNFGPNFVGPIYVTGTQNLTYSIDRTIAGDFATTATIALSGSTTAVEGLDYTGSTFPLTLSWADQETGSKTFTVNFLNNSARTGTLFVPFISASTTASIGTASFSTTQIVHPGILKYASLSATVVEGATQAITVRRESGSFGDVTGNLTYGGDATRNTDYTAPDTFTMADGEVSISFNVVTVDDIIEDGQSESATIEISSLIYPFSASLYYPTASIDTVNDTFTLTITDNETGSVNFLVDSSSVAQPGSPGSTSVTITVERSGGIDFAATATITQTGGTATTSDYSGLPATLNWEDQDGDNKTFTISGINGWGDDGATLQMGFTTLINLSTGTHTASHEVTFTNTIISESPDANPLVSPDGTINRYANAVTGRKNKANTLPFSIAQKTATALRQRSGAGSGSAGGSKNG